MRTLKPDEIKKAVEEGRLAFVRELADEGGEE